MTRHPELAQLQSDYTEILSRHNAGLLSVEATLEAVALLWVTDGAGYNWSIDPQTGDWIRAVPGEAPQSAAEHQFAPLMVTPAPDHLLPSAPMAAGGTSLLEGDVGDLLQTDLEEGGPSMISTITGHKYFKWVAVAATVFILFAGLKACGSSTTVDPNPGGVPIVTGDSITSTTTTVVSTSTTAAGGFADSDPAGSAPPVPLTPTAVESSEITSTLVSGNRELFAKTFNTSLDPVTIALKSAEYSGYFENGITVDLGIATPGSEPGVAQSEAVLSDSVSGAGITRASVTWVFVDGIWKLAELPSWG